MSWESDYSLDLCYTISHEAVIKVLARAMVSTEGSNGEGCASKHIEFNSVDQIQFFEGFWIESNLIDCRLLSVPCHVDFSICFFIKSIWEEPERTSRRVPARQKSHFYNLILQETCHHFCLNLLIRTKSFIQPILRGSRLHNRVNTRRQGSMRIIFKTACHNNKSPEVRDWAEWNSLHTVKKVVIYIVCPET